MNHNSIMMTWMLSVGMFNELPAPKQESMSGLLKEYELIKQKKSNLPANERSRITRKVGWFLENNQ